MDHETSQIVLSTNPVASRRIPKCKLLASTWYLPNLGSNIDILDSLEVRPIRMDEGTRWRNLMSRHHYLSFQNTVGEAVCYVAILEGHWVALLAWAAAAFKSRHREAWVGWDEKLKTQRLHFVSNNVRFLIHPHLRLKNLASKVLAKNLRRLSEDWEVRYGHPILLVETFVDEHRHKGTCYRAAGWIPLGKTRGFGRNRRGYFSHGSIKTLFVRGLYPDSLQMLSAPFPPATPSQGTRFLDVNHLHLEGPGGLLEVLNRLEDPRKLRGRRHSIVTIAAMAAFACLAGASSYQGISQWASGLSNDAIRRLGGRRLAPPSEPTFRRVLQQLDRGTLNRQLYSWLAGHAKMPRKSIDRFRNILWIGRKR